MKNYVNFDASQLGIGMMSVEETGNSSNGGENKSEVKVTCFSDVSDGTVLHFQIIHLSKQIYVWIGFNSARLGHLYAAAPTRPKYTASVTPILGGASDNVGSGIARRLVLKTGLNIILACNIPKNNPIAEAQAEKMLIRKLTDLGYTKPRSESPLS